MTINRFKGAVLGLALGDAFGAPHEGGVVERALWRIIGKRSGKCRWTDDTQMTVDLAESFLALGRIDQDDLAYRFAHSYRWSRGYGPGAANVLKRILRGQPWKEASRAVYPGGSFGNGGAMRAPLVGLLFYAAPEAVLVEAAGAVTEITHAHPLALEGAALVACATALAVRDLAAQAMISRLRRLAKSPVFSRRLQLAETWLQQKSLADPRAVAVELGRGVAAADSCVTAIYLALHFLTFPFTDLLAYSISLGGDADTLAAMAGAIWGAANGAEKLPPALLGRLEQAERLARLAEELADRVGEPPGR